jgi:hypothetical protein
MALLIHFISSSLLACIYYRFIFAMEDSVGMCIGHTSMQERAFEQLFAKCPA